MRNDLTDITMIVDRSGSMASIKSDAEGGINTFVELQKREPGEALLTLVQFDTHYEFVHSGIPIKQVPAFTLVPRGGTAPLDAVGRAINELFTRQDCECSYGNFPSSRPHETLCERRGNDRQQIHG